MKHLVFFRMLQRHHRRSRPTVCRSDHGHRGVSGWGQGACIGLFLAFSRPWLKVEKFPDETTLANFRYIRAVCLTLSGTSVIFVFAFPLEFLMLLCSLHFFFSTLHSVQWKVWSGWSWGEKKASPLVYILLLWNVFLSTDKVACKICLSWVKKPARWLPSYGGALVFVRSGTFIRLSGSGAAPALQKYNHHPDFLLPLCAAD